MRWIAAVSVVAILGVGCQGDVDDGDDDDDVIAADADPLQPDADPLQPDAAPDLADARPMGRIENRSYTFGNGNLVEGTLVLAEGDQFIWTITSSGGDAFYNIHAHAGGRTVTYVEDEGSAVEYGFTAPHSGFFYFLLGNTSAPGTISVDISFELFGSAEVTDWGD